MKKTIIYLLLLLSISTISARDIFQKRKYTRFKKGNNKTVLKTPLIKEYKSTVVFKETTQTINSDEQPPIESTAVDAINNNTEEVKTVKVNVVKTKKIKSNKVKVDSLISSLQLIPLNKNKQIAKEHTYTKPQNTAKANFRILNFFFDIYIALAIIAALFGIIAGYYYLYLFAEAIFWILAGTTLFFLILNFFSGTKQDLALLMLISLALFAIVLGLIYLFSIPSWGSIAAIAIITVIVSFLTVLIIALANMSISF